MIGAFLTDIPTIIIVIVAMIVYIGRKLEYNMLSNIFQEGF